MINTNLHTGFIAYRIVPHVNFGAYQMRYLSFTASAGIDYLIPEKWRMKVDPFNLIAAIIAGLIATAVMTGILYLVLKLLPEQMPLDVFYLMGTMITRDNATVYVTGGVMHFVVGTMFGIIQILIYQMLGISSGLYLWGILVGGVNWLIVGAGMGMLGAIHPMIREGGMDDPGFFVRNLPMLTVVGFLVLHIVFGVVNGAVYEGLRGVF